LLNKYILARTPVGGRELKNAMEVCSLVNEEKRIISI